MRQQVRLAWLDRHYGKQVVRRELDEIPVESTCERTDNRAVDGLRKQRHGSCRRVLIRRREMNVLRVDCQILPGHEVGALEVGDKWKSAKIGELFGSLEHRSG